MLTNEATAELNIQSFDIPDKDKEVAGPVASARLTTTAEYNIEAEKQPTRVVLRLEGKRTDDYTQLAATELMDYSTTMSGTKELDGSLLDLEGLTAADLSPSDVGETKTVDVSVRLLLTVQRDGRTLAEHSAEDTVTINVTRGTASATIELGGSGSVSISES